MSRESIGPVEGAPAEATGVGTGEKRSWMPGPLRGRDRNSGLDRRVRTAPVRLLDVELGGALPPIRPEADKRAYRRARVLVRLHGHPLGSLDLDLPAGRIDAATLAGRTWDALAPKILTHLEEDRIPAVSSLTEAGIARTGVPACLRQALGHTEPVTVVVPTRDRPRRLAACLDSILNADYPSSSLEVLVVDNAPAGPATRELVENRFGHLPNIRYLLEPRPGSALARNRGLSEARSSIVAFVDDDVLVDRLWLRSVVNGFQAASGVGSVTSLIVPAELETLPQIWIEEFGGFDKGYERKIYDLDEHAPPDPLYPYTMGRFGSGAAMAFDRGVLADLGGFDPVLHRGQDIDALLRVVLAGHRLVYEPRSLVRHYHHRYYHNLRRTMHGYGAGLSAVLTKTILRREHRGGMLRRAPRGLAYLLRPSSEKNRQKSASYPRELTALELLGVLSGPLAYFRRRRRKR